MLFSLIFSERLTSIGAGVEVARGREGVVDHPLRHAVASEIEEAHALAGSAHLERDGLDRARLLALEHGAQAVDVHRLVQAVEQRLVHQRVVDGLDAVSMLEELRRERRAIAIRLLGEERWIDAAARRSSQARSTWAIIRAPEPPNQRLKNIYCRCRREFCATQRFCQTDSCPNSRMF